jgi:hypothetical protein
MLLLLPLLLLTPNTVSLAIWQRLYYHYCSDTAVAAELLLLLLSLLLLTTCAGTAVSMCPL